MPKPYKVQDKYFLMAKQKGYRARSAFKLLDIQKKFHILKTGDKVIDLGSAPGSFIQVISDIIGPKGSVLGIDLQEIEEFDMANIKILRGDIFETEKVLESLRGSGFGEADVLTSDLAPKTTGIKDVDQGRSVELTDQAFFLASKLLKPGAHFIGKVFEGADLPWLMRRVKKKFEKVTLFKPPSCRDRSFERFIVARFLKK